MDTATCPPPVPVREEPMRAYLEIRRRALIMELKSLETLLGISPKRQ